MIKEEIINEILEGKWPLDCLSIYIFIYNETINKKITDSKTIKKNGMEKGKWGYGKWKRTIDELRKNGFIEFKRLRNENGFISGAVYKITRI